ncbi:DUF5626 family protein [Paenibacillus elgii]|uniref:DUF5626 family protein n=1 Tax=Paenibacillus elgii TaxID=189691 RepID=UPI000FDC5570|nr:DUF5626 family protein [Paenibacillus elgii]NEN84133.1 hypothetical protein [Paenibacillus elgii]
MKKISTLALIASLSMSFAAVGSAEDALKPSTSTQVQVNQTKLSQRDIDGLKQGFTEFGVSPTTQESLIKKIEAGQLIDSINPEMKDKGFAVETTAETEDSIIRTTKVTFPDGSVRVQNVSEPKQTIFPSAVEGGLKQCGSGYCTVTDATVSDSAVVFKADFKASYTLVDGDFNDSISSVRDYHITTYGGTYSNADLKIDKQNESLEGPARASLRFAWTAWNGSTTSTYYLHLYVGNNKATSQQG